ncbi:MAG: ribonuclease HI [Pseudomonadota bacterium]
MTETLEPKEVIIYTDGSCLGNPGPGGWAAILIHPQKTLKLSGGFAKTTNNRMEMMAAIEGLSQLKLRCRVKLHTDSQYLQKGLTSWLACWKKKNWVTAAKTPVKNKDLWQTLDDLMKKHEIEFIWVRGHAGNQYNEECDQLAVKAAKGKNLPKDVGFPGLEEKSRPRLF